MIVCSSGSWEGAGGGDSVASVNITFSSSHDLRYRLSVDAWQSLLLAAIYTGGSICSSISKIGNTANTALSTLSICSISTCKYLVFARKTEYLLSTCSVTVVPRADFCLFPPFLRKDVLRAALSLSPPHPRPTLA